MRLRLRNVGSSIGLIIPKKILEEYNLRGMIELELEEDGLKIRSVDQPRQGWEEQFRKEKDNKMNEDQLLLPEIFDEEELEDFDFGDKDLSNWEW